MIIPWSDDNYLNETRNRLIFKFVGDIGVIYMEFEIDKIEKLAKINNLPKKQFKDLR